MADTELKNNCGNRFSTNDNIVEYLNLNPSISEEKGINLKFPISTTGFIYYKNSSKSEEYQIPHNNFEKETICQKLITDDTPRDSVLKFLADSQWEIPSPNTNYSLHKFSEKIINRNIKIDPIYKIPYIKLSIAWLYGFTDCDIVRNAFIDLWDSDVNLDISDIIKIIKYEIRSANKNHDPEDIDIFQQIWMKYSKFKRPFLFTPYELQLSLLGITAKESKQIYNNKDWIMNSFEIYGYDVTNYIKLITNPYAWYMISIDKAHHIIKITKRDPMNFIPEITLGEISRNINKNSKKLAWTATPEVPDILIHKDILTSDYGISYDYNHFYIRHIRDEEMNVANFIINKSQLLDNPFSTDFNHNALNELSEEQTTVVKHALNHVMTFISGEAGTGKTKILGALAEIISSKNIKFIACGFTGKSVERIIAVLGPLASYIDNEKEILNARTIHSLISCRKRESRTTSNIKYLLIDEASMISLSLMSKLFNCFNNTDTCIILFGDVNQLPPIEYGRPAEDLFNSSSNKIKFCRLTKNYRMMDGDTIIINSQSIIQDNKYQVTHGENFRLFIYPINKLIELICSDRMTVNNIRSWKILTTSNYLAYTIHNSISQIINPTLNKYRKFRFMVKKQYEKEKSPIEVIIAIGDPIMFTRNKSYIGHFNNKQKYMLNGNEGIVTDFINADNGYHYMKVNHKNYIIKVPLKTPNNKLIPIIPKTSPTISSTSPTISSTSTTISSTSTTSTTTYSTSTTTYSTSTTTSTTCSISSTGLSLENLPYINTEMSKYLIRTVCENISTEEDLAKFIIFEIDDVIPSYAITIYKSQGSEWENIYLFMNGRPKYITNYSNKRLSYTAITRAKNKCSVIETNSGVFIKSSQTPCKIHHGCLTKRLL